MSASNAADSADPSDFADPTKASDAASAELTLFAPCPLGLEDTLAEEVRSLGARQVRARRAGVALKGDLETAYRVCLWSRVASRLLLRIAEVPAPDPEALYAALLELPWEEHVSPQGTLRSTWWPRARRSLTPGMRP